jgi:uncharacterized membrane protein YccC
MASSFVFILSLVGLSRAARYFAGVAVILILSASLDSDWFEIENLPSFSLPRCTLKYRLNLVGLGR